MCWVLQNQSGVKCQNVLLLYICLIFYKKETVFNSPELHSGLSQLFEADTWISALFQSDRHAVKDEMWKSRGFFFFF